MYIVLDNDKPATLSTIIGLSAPVVGWRINEYSTLEAALKYAHDWLGIYSPGIKTLRINLDGYEYSGYGDIIKIIKK